MQYRHRKGGHKFSADQGRKAKGYLPEDTLRYYRHVSDALTEGFESEELKNVFLNNAFRQLSEEVVQVAQNQTVSRIIETLASHAKPSHLCKLFVALTADLSVAFLDRVPDMAQNQVGSYLLEVVFRLSSPDLLREVFTSVLKGRLLYYAIHPVANYVLQRFISYLKDKGLMEEVFDELSKVVEDILAVGHLGLITSLADACRRLHLKQEEFVTVGTLMEAFHCKEPEHRQQAFPKLVSSFTAYEVYFKVDEDTGKAEEETALTGPVNMHGSLLLQQLLQFDKPKFVAPAIAALKPAEVCVLCCDPAGSHVMDVFFSSHTVLEKNKDILLKKLKGLLMEVACTKNGSRCLESIWKSLNVKQRTRIAEELAESEARLRSDRFGHFLHHNLAIPQFVQRRQLWLEQQGAQSKRKRMMAELLHGKEVPAKKKKGEEDYSHLKLQEDEEDKVTALFTKHLKDTSSTPIAHADSDTSDQALQGITENKTSAKKSKKTAAAGDNTAKKMSAEDQRSRKESAGSDEDQTVKSDTSIVHRKKQNADTKAVTKKAKKAKFHVSESEADSQEDVEEKATAKKKNVKRKRKDSDSTVPAPDPITKDRKGNSIAEEEVIKKTKEKTKKKYAVV
nr:hypothetical protein BaRGS_003809 [Batillaria attramentaria]